MDKGITCTAGNLALEEGSILMVSVHLQLFQIRKVIINRKVGEVCTSEMSAQSQGEEREREREREREKDSERRERERERERVRWKDLKRERFCYTDK